MTDTAATKSRLNLPELTVSELSGALKRTIEDAYGYVRVRGELWRAISKTPVAPGQAIRVLDIHGLTLNVEPLMASTRQGESSSLP